VLPLRVGPEPADDESPPPLPPREVACPPVLLAPAVRDLDPWSSARWGRSNEGEYGAGVVELAPADTGALDAPPLLEVVELEAPEDTEAAPPPPSPPRATAVPTVLPFDGREPSCPARALALVMLTTPTASATVPKTF